MPPEDDDAKSEDEDEAPKPPRLDDTSDQGESEPPHAGEDSPDTPATVRNADEPVEPPDIPMGLESPPKRRSRRNDRNPRSHNRERLEAHTSTPRRHVPREASQRSEIPNSTPESLEDEATDPRLQDLVTSAINPRAARYPQRAWGIPSTFAGRWLSWLYVGIYSQATPIVVALFCAWTGLIFALWASVLGLILGVLVAIGLIASNAATSHLLHSGAGEAVGILGAISGGLVGAGTGFISVYTHELFGNSATVVFSIVSGSLLACVAVLVIARFEETLLHFRGARRLVPTEMRRISPIVQTLAAELGLVDLPRIVICKEPVPGAWTHMRHVVITEELLDTLDGPELAAVLAHELTHWRYCDSVGAHMVWACAFPIIVVYNLATLASGFRPNASSRAAWPGRGLVVFVAWMIAWPCWIMIRLIITPVFASSSRNNEYRCDEWVKIIGRGPALIAALRKLSIFEPARTGWEAVLNASHPSMALRIDWLMPESPDDKDYRESDLGLLESPRVRHFASTALFVLVFAIAGATLGALGLNLPWVPSGSAQPRTVASLHPVQSDTGPSSPEMTVETFVVAYLDNLTNVGAYHRVIAEYADPSEITALQATADADIEDNPFRIIQSRGTVTGCSYDPGGSYVDVHIVWTYREGNGRVYQSIYDNVITISNVDGAWKVEVVPSFPDSPFPGYSEPTEILPPCK